MRLFWDKDDTGNPTLYTEPKAKLLTLRDIGDKRWHLACLGETKVFGIESLDIVKKLAEQWLTSFLCDVVIELRKRDATVS